jgi:hypothetical protein
MLLLVAGFLLTGHKLLTPLLMVLIIFLNDFLTMALTTDRMSVSPRPNPWRPRPIVIAGVVRFAAIGFHLRRVCHRPLRAAFRHAAPAIADLRRHHSRLTSGRLSAPRARALLGVATEPRNAMEHFAGAGRDRVHHTGGISCSGHQSAVVCRRGRGRWNMSGNWRCGIEATSRSGSRACDARGGDPAHSSTQDHFRIQTGPPATLDRRAYSVPNP